jgi:C4-dicarboxylate transporter DctM subunit
VLVRYFTSQSFAWTEEFSVFLMIVLALVAGSAAVARNRHIRIEYFSDNGSMARQQAPGAIRRADGVPAVRADRRAEHAHGVGRLPFEETSPGIGVPQWWYTVWLPVCRGHRAARARPVHPPRASPPSRQAMIATLLFVAFLAMMLVGVPIGAALGLAGAACIALANADAQWFGLLAVPQNFYSRASASTRCWRMPMFVLVGSIFDRSGVALRLVNFAIAIVGRGPGMLPLVAIAGGHVPGRHLGLGPGQRSRRGRGDDRRHVARRLPGRVLGQRGRRRRGHRHPDPALGRLHRVFGAGARRLGAGAVRGRHDPRHPGRHRADDAGGVAGAQAQDGRARSHAAAAAVLAQPARSDLGPGRAGADPGRHARGWFTPTEAAVVAVFYGLFVGMVVHRTIKVRDLFVILRESGELSAVILLVVSLAGIFAYSLSTLGVIDPVARPSSIRAWANTACWRC